MKKRILSLILTFLLILSLVQVTGYGAYVKADEGEEAQITVEDEESGDLVGWFVTDGTPASEIGEVDAENITTTMPFYSVYKYGYSEQIFSAEEVGNINYLSGIALYVTAPFSGANVKIFLADTDKDNLNDGEEILLDEAAEVYSGTAPFGETGWRNIAFQKGFLHDPEKNLAIIFQGQTDGGGDMLSVACFYSETDDSDYASFGYRDASPIAPGEDPIFSGIRVVTGLFGGNVFTSKAVFNSNTGENEIETRQYMMMNAKTKLRPNSFTREGYQFVGWNTERDGSGTAYADEDEVTLSEDTVFYAQWEECIKITFRSAGSADRIQYVLPGVETRLDPHSPDCDGFHFANWNTRENAGGREYPDEALVTFYENTVLYAVRKAKEADYSFNEDPEQHGWTFVDADGDGKNWSYLTDGYYYDHTSGVAGMLIASESYDGTGYTALTPDNWAITPVFSVPKDADHPTVSFYAKGASESFPDEMFSVYAVEAGNVNLSNLNPTDWICISSVGDIKATKYYKNYSFSLEQFKGKDIYVAIRHYHVSDQYALLVDDFRFDGTDALTYKKIARTEPNLGKEGNVECWLGSDGNHYRLKNGRYILMERDEWILEALDFFWPFTDVKVNPSNWKYEGIKFVYEHGIMTGDADNDNDGFTTFNPKGNITRGEFITTLYRLDGEKEVEGNMPFTDVKKNKFYYTPVLWALTNEITTGTSATTFSPKDNITRQDMATLLMRFAGYMGFDTSGRADIRSMPDYSRVKSYARDAMAWANYEGIITGKDIDGKKYLDPRANATRQETATILQRFMERYMSEE